MSSKASQAWARKHMQKRGWGPEEQAEHTRLRKENVTLRNAARESGALTYRRTTPCPQGHFLRYTSNGNCAQCHHVPRIKLLRAANSRKRRYGLTPEVYSDMLIGQDNSCCICLAKFTESNKPMVDHCHSTGVVRGLLCNKCNVCLGYWKDSPMNLIRAEQYLLRARISHPQGVTP